MPAHSKPLLRTSACGVTLSQSMIDDVANGGYLEADLFQVALRQGTQNIEKAAVGGVYTLGKPFLAL